MDMNKQRGRKLGSGYALFISAKDGVNVTLFIHPYHGPSKVSPTQQWFLTQGGRLSTDN